MQRVDIIVKDKGNQIELTAVYKLPMLSSVACQVLLDMKLGTLVYGSRVIQAEDAEAAFDELDRNNLITLTLG